MRTAEDYRASLRDGREVYFRGQPVADVTRHSVLGVAVDHAAIDYELAEDPAVRDLAVVTDPATGETISRYYHIPTSSADLRLRSALIEESCRRGKTLVVLIKEIGTDALFALHLVAQEARRANREPTTCHGFRRSTSTASGTTSPSPSPRPM